MLAIKTMKIKQRKQEDLKMDKTYACKIIGSIVYGSKKKKNRSFRETTFITKLSKQTNRKCSQMKNKHLKEDDEGVTTSKGHPKKETAKSKSRMLTTIIL